MIQELLGGGGGGGGHGHGHGHGVLGGGDRKIPILEASSSPSPSSPSPCSSPATPNAAAPAPPPEGQNLRCPRCDSTNTKFCYYNNYNLTQPRHFCKTCRRYWTKGGALRNVPIGGGCRKNKNVTFTSPIATKVGAAVGRFRALSPDTIGRQGGLGFDPNSPILWSAPQNCSNLIAMLRSAQTQNQNPNPNPNPSPISCSSMMKEENGMIGSHLNNLPFNNNQQSPVLWRNNQTQLQQTELVLGHEVQNTGLQDLYQRLRSTGSYYPDNHSSSVLLNNVVTPSSSSLGMVLESAPVVAGGELSYWNPTPSWAWSDLPTTDN